MSKDKLDEMREKLKLSHLGENQKKEMFQKFVDAGGQVVDLDKARREKEQEERLKKAQSRKAGAGRVDYVPPVRPSRTTKTQKNVPDLSANARVDNPVNRWIERFSACVECFFGSVLSFNGRNFKEAFRDIMLVDFQNTLLSGQMIDKTVCLDGRSSRKESAGLTDDIGSE